MDQGSENLVSQVQANAEKQGYDLRKDAHDALNENQGKPFSETPPNVSNVEKMASENKSEGFFEGMVRIGEKEHASWMESMRTKYNEVKEATKQVWQGVKENSSKIISFGEALISTKGRDFMGRKLEEKYDLVEEKVYDKKEKVVGAFQERYNALAKRAKDEFVDPAVEMADDIRNGVVDSARAGYLFGRTVKEVAVGTGAIVGEAGKQVIGGVKEIAGEVKEAVDARARRWGGEVADFFKDNVENVRRGVQKSGMEMTATFYSVQAKGIMVEVEGEVQKGLASREAMIKMADKLDRSRKLQVKALLARQYTPRINPKPVDEGFHKIKL